MADDTFDYDLFVIGGGSGGVRAARVAAGEYGAKVALAEDDQRIMNAVLTERADIDAEQRQGELDYLASKTASLTVEHMTRWLAKNLPKLHG